jgi:hypothetical protein
MSFLEELKRRSVIKVAVAYAAAAWIVLQVADVILDNLDAPPSLFPAILAVALLGFPIAVVLSWAFEWTPDGLRRDPDSGKLPANRLFVVSSSPISSEKENDLQRIQRAGPRLGMPHRRLAA